jgi:hypothetical protein
MDSDFYNKKAEKVLKDVFQTELDDARVNTRGSDLSECCRNGCHANPKRGAKLLYGGWPARELPLLTCSTPLAMGP